MIIIASYSNVSVTYTANGTQTVFSFPFDYLRKAFVYVEVNGETVLEQGTDYTVSDDKTVIFQTAPVADTVLRIYRQTDTTPLVSWADASVLRATDMTIQQVQELHILEEYQYNNVIAVTTANEAKEIAEGISETATEALANSEEALTVANGIAGTAQEALDNSEEALETANGIAGTAQEALNMAERASDAAADAVDTVEALETQVTTNTENITELLKSALWYDNVATLVADTKLEAGKVAVTKGFYSAGDGGSSIYLIRAKASGETTDTWSLLQLATNTLVAELYVPDGMLNVKQCGAYGDNSTDDYTYVRYALLNSEYKTILFPPGTYAISGRLNVKEGFHLIGHDAILRKTDPSTSFLELGERNITVENLRITRGVQRVRGNTTSLILIHSTTGEDISNIRVTNCIICDADMYGVNIQDSSHYVRGVFVDHCKIYNVAVGVKNGGGYTRNVVIDSCIISDTLGECVTFDGTVQYSKLTNCTLYNNDAGVGLVGCDQSSFITIANNTFTQVGNPTTSTSLKRGITFNRHMGICNGYTIANNVFVSCVVGVLCKKAETDSQGTWVYNGVKNLVWGNNVFINSIDADIQIDNIEGTNRIANNVLSSAGIVLDNANIKNIRKTTTFVTGVSQPKDVPIQKIKDIMQQLVFADRTITVKLIGDSITMGHGGTGFAQDGEDLISGYKVNTSGHCWANSLRDYLQSKFSNVTVKNYGVNSQKSGNILLNISTLVKNTDDIVICMLGANDRLNSADPVSGATNSPTTLYNNLIGIYNYCKNLGIPIIFMSSNPCTPANEASNKVFHMEDVDHVVMKVAHDNNMEYISNYKLFGEYVAERQIELDDVLRDGLHPNDFGYDILFHIICEQLGFGVDVDKNIALEDKADSLFANKYVPQTQIEAGRVSVSIPAGVVTAEIITFPKAFTAVPIVTLTMGGMSSGGLQNPQLIQFYTNNIMKTGFTLRAYNTGTATYTLEVNWIAMLPTT